MEFTYFFKDIKKFRKTYNKKSHIEAIYLNDGLMALVLGKFLKNKPRPIIMTVHGLDVVFPLGYFQRWVRKIGTHEVFQDSRVKTWKAYFFCCGNLL